MTDIGEAVAVSIILDEEDKCIFCGGSHDEPKSEEIKEVASGDKGWQRKSMQGIFEQISAKKSIYPDNSFPPKYEYQGHHCIALSAFSFDSNSSSPRDKNKTLNHFLSKVGFFPNRDKNCIGLPARKSYGAFTPFWEALDANKPLQLHGPGHDESYFLRCNALITQLLTVFTDESLCEALSHDEMEKELKELIENAENYAFIQLCSLTDGGWDLHKNERTLAEKIYTSPVEESFNVRGANNVYRTETGKGNVDKTIGYPEPSLETGSFKKRK